MAVEVSPVFRDYWYQGKAEVASYQLSQSRYGELHQGKAVLIFVTEDFSRQKQVKLDYPAQAGEDKVGILKMNFTKKFNTGLYPYSMMLSVFTPIEKQQHANTLKTTMSSQEWCGHVFAQMNLEDKKYKVNSFSYFEQESDQSFKLEKTLLEDELWNLIRLDHKALPEGDIKITPGLFYTRMMHQDLKPLAATAVLTASDTSMTYTLTIPEYQRTLAITFEKAFPHQILSWKESYPGMRGAMLTTTATLDKTLFTDYWTKNKNEYTYLRDSLNLDE